MKKIAALLVGITLSAAASAQTNSQNSDDTLTANSSVTTIVLGIAAPLVLFTAIAIAAENSDTPNATLPSTTTATIR